MPEPFADAGCPGVLAGRLPRSGAVFACAFFRDAWLAAAAEPPLAAAGADDLAADGFAAAEPVVAPGLAAPAGLAEPDGFPAGDGFAPADGFGATALAEVSLLTADGLAGAALGGAVPVVPPPAGAAPGTGAG